MAKKITTEDARSGAQDDQGSASWSPEVSASTSDETPPEEKPDAEEEDALAEVQDLLCACYERLVRAEARIAELSATAEQHSTLLLRLKHFL